MESSSNNCYVCSNYVSPRESFSVYIDDSSSSPGRQLNKLLTEILDETVERNEPKSVTLCKKCHKTCTEYDVIEKRLTEIKNDLKLQFRDSLQKHDVSNASTSSSSPIKIEKSPQKKVIVSSSKLMPVPATFKLNNKLKLLSNTSAAPKIVSSRGSLLLNNNKPIRVNTSQKCLPTILSRSKKKIPAPTTKLRRIAPKISVTIPNYTISSPVTTTSSSLLNTVSVLPGSSTMMKDFLMLATSQEENVEDGIDIMQVINGCEVGMDIQGGHSNAIVEDNESNNENQNEEQENTESNELIKLSLGDTEDTEKDNSEYMKVEILENDDDDVLETLIMEEDECGSLIRVISGQKIIYVNDEISVIIPEAESDKDSTTTEHENIECLELEEEDNEEESQIELRAAGDEETANAIIEAASTEGGAFIKVQSGEMYRVESVATEKETTQSTGEEHDGYNVIKKIGDKYQCLLCENVKLKKKGATSFITSDATAIMRHARNEHHARVYVCWVCGLILRKKRDYSTHILTHMKDVAVDKDSLDKLKHYQCDICSKSLRSRNMLKDHLKTHICRRPYECQKCNRKFTSKYTLSVHIKTHEDRPRPFRCCKCTKSFYTQQNLMQHEKTHSTIKDYLCKICNKSFSTQHNLELHDLVHNGLKTFHCEVCGKSFARRAEVIDHHRTHTGEKPFECDLCYARFSQRSNLHTHRRATHFDDRRHACQMCDKRFKRRRLLEYHVRAAHTGERPYKCDTCSATFVYPEHYKKHLRVHTGERPYGCESCGKLFKTRDNRNIHRFTHSETKPYECIICGAGFMRKPMLLAHMDNYGHLSETIIINKRNPLAGPDSDNSDEEESTGNIVKTTSDEKSVKVFLQNSYLPTIEENDDSEKDNNAAEPNVLNSKDLLLTDADDPLYTVSFDTSNSARELFGSASISDEVCESTKINLLDASIISNKDIQVLSNQEILAKDETGAMVKLVQMQLDNGETGWVALNT